jgi:zinc protease
MKNIASILLAVFVFFVACTPKTADKMAGTKPTAPSVPSMGTKSTTIPIPTGDVRKNSPQPGNAPSINIAKAETFTLDNGLKVIVVENHKLPKVSFQIFVDADPVLEKDATGYVDMMGDLLSKGTTTRSKSKLDEEIDFLGASFSSNSNGVSGECLSRHSDKLLALMSDVLLNPAFSEEELKKAKTKAQSGLAQSKDNANAIASNVAAVLRNSKSHPYGEIMNEASLEKINMDQIKAYYSTFIKPNVSYFVVVGDVTKAKAEAYAKQYFGNWKRGDVPKNTYKMPTMPEKTQINFVNKPGAVQSVISVTYPVELVTGNEDGIRARLMNTILGGYFNSRINANLREAHAYTYGARSSLNPNKVVGSFSAGASVRNAVTDSSIIQLIYELSRIRDEKIPAKELQLVKNVLTGQFAMNLEKPETVAEFALNTARFNLPSDFYEKYLERLSNVTAEEIQAMAKKYIRPDRAHILVVGNQETVAPSLAQFSPDGKVNMYDVNGDPIRPAGKIPAGVTGQIVIADYINAIGGESKILAIKDLVIVQKIATGGPELQLTTWQTAAGKYASDMLMNGKSMSKQVYDGKDGMDKGMGAPPAKMEGTTLGDAKENAQPCKELFYLKGEYKLNLKGLEEINGKKVYVMEVIRPDGKVTTEYYDMATSLKMREVSTTTQGGESSTMTIDYADFKAVNGVLFAHSITLGGVFPTPLKGEITEIKANGGIPDTTFKM